MATTQKLYKELMEEYENTSDESVRASLSWLLDSTLDTLLAECQEVEERACESLV